MKKFLNHPTTVRTALGKKVVKEPQPYNALRFYTQEGEAQVSNIKVHQLGL